jgi:predicted ATP-grasp superfamily ATP-dependent carboligase
MSALRAGLTVCAADLFADADLARLCTARRVESYPTGLIDACGDAEPGEWLYTGALENHPALVERMARLRPLLGNGGKALRTVRDPWKLAAGLARGGFAMPEMRRSAAGLPRDGTWLRKAIRSAGGIQTSTWDAGNDAAASVRGWYFQRRVEGLACSAVYVMAGGRAALVGATRQLVGETWTGASGFRYCGSNGPLPLDIRLHATLGRLGDCLAGEFELRGLVGVDFLLSGQTVWPVEVNPRYTASVEVLERSLGIAAIGWHVEACRTGMVSPKSNNPVPSGVEGNATTNNFPVPASDAARPTKDSFPVLSPSVGRAREGGPPHPSPIRPSSGAGKAILFARHDLIVPPTISSLAAELNLDPLLPALADLPHAGQAIRAGWPVLTVLCDAATQTEVLSVLRSLVRQCEDLLYSG